MLEHIENMQHLPEDKQADEDQAVAEIQLVVAGERPKRACKEKNRQQGQQQRQVI